MSNVSTPTVGYLSARSFSTDAGPFSHAGGGTAPFNGHMRWVVRDLAQLPSNVGAYLEAQSVYAPADTWVSTSYAGRWYALLMDTSGPVYMTFAQGDPGLGAPLPFHPGPIHTLDPAQALANFGGALAQYLGAHGCDGTAQMSTLVKGYEGALNTFMASLKVPPKTPYVPFVVDGIYSNELQALLVEFAKVHNITFTPCTGLPTAARVGFEPPPPGEKTGGPLQTTTAPTGLSTNAKIGIGVGVLAVGAIGIWVLSQHGKKKR